VSNWSALLLLIPLSWNYIAINGLIDGAGLFYCYDIPSLAFYVIGLIFFLKNSWFWFYLIFIFANLNRESACFISLSGFLLQLKLYKNPKLFFRENKNLVFHIITQAVLWIIMRSFLSWIYRGNSGLFFEEPHYISDFISGIWNGNSHWAMENAAWFLTLFAGIWLIPILLFNKLSTHGKRLIIVAVIYLISLYFRSNMMETRVYNELNVIISICAIICLTNFIKTKRGFA
jgi:surface polysaccharide O-acyltransferase-like enzyme